MWKVIYHHKIESDLRLLGYAEARRILKAIDKRLIQGEPHKIGKPLSGDLAGCRRLQVGNTRIVYKVNQRDIEVLIIAVGARRDDLIYHTAEERV